MEGQGETLMEGIGSVLVLLQLLERGWARLLTNDVKMGPMAYGLGTTSTKVCSGRIFGTEGKRIVPS